MLCTSFTLCTSNIKPSDAPNISCINDGMKDGKDCITFAVWGLTSGRDLNICRTQAYRGPQSERSWIDPSIVPVESIQAQSFALRAPYLHLACALCGNASSEALTTTKCDKCGLGCCSFEMCGASARVRAVLTACVPSKDHLMARRLPLQRAV